MSPFKEPVPTPYDDAIVHPRSRLETRMKLVDGEWVEVSVKDIVDDAIEKQSPEILENETKFAKSEASKLDGAESILATIQKSKERGYPLNQSTIAYHIYGYLTRRYSVSEYHDLLTRFTKEQYLAYDTTLSGIGESMQQLGYTVIDRGAWFSIYAANGDAVDSKRYIAENEEVGVDYKQYFTINPTEVKPGIFTVENFVSALPEISAKLRDICEEQNDIIKLKVPSSLAELQIHPDSLVIHYRNQKTGDLVRRAIEEIFLQKQISSGRSGRVRSGFDLRQIKNGQTQSKSHSELISQLAADLIVQDVARNGSFFYFNPEEMVEWLDTTLARLGNLQPEDVIATIRAGK